MIKPEWLLTEEECDRRAILTWDSVNKFTPYQAWAFGIGEGAKAQVEKIAEWGNETCPHYIFGEGTQCFKHACDMCWNTLSGEGE